MSLQIELEHCRQALVVRLQGELDHHTAEMVKKQMEDAIFKNEIRHIVLNLKHLSFMDSSGLGVVLGRYKQIASLGGKMVVCDANPSVHRLFEMSGLFKILLLEDTEKEAIASLEVVS